MGQQLWIDDIRTPVDDTIVVVRTYDDAIVALQSERFSDIYLDHDLACYDSAGNERSGYHAVLWMVEQFLNGDFTPPERFHMLTSNPVGRKNMTELINRYFPDSEVVR